MRHFVTIFFVYQTNNELKKLPFLIARQHLLIKFYSWKRSYHKLRIFSKP